MAEPPEDVLREERRRRRRALSNDCTIISHEQHGERQRRDDHVEPDHRRAGSRRTARTSGLVCESLRPEVAEADRDRRAGSRAPGLTACRAGPITVSQDGAGTRSRSRGRRAAPTRGRSPSPVCRHWPALWNGESGRGTPTTPAKCMTERRHEDACRRRAPSATTSPAPSRARSAANAEADRDCSIQNAKPITAKPAQPRNAPRPCAVISAYQVLASTRPRFAWLSIAAARRAGRTRAR